MNYLWYLIAVLLFLVSLPATVEILFLTVGAILASIKKHSNFKDQSSSKVTIAVVVPAHNEEANIGRTIDSLKACHGSFDIIIIADNCTDRTADLARQKGVRVIERLDPLLRGKHYALHYAFEKLVGEGYDLFIIIDADTIASADIVASIQQVFLRGADAVQVYYGILNPEQSIRLRLMNISFFAFNLLRPLGRYYWNLSAGILGNGFALSRKTLTDVPFQSKSIVEDLAYHLLLVKAGKKVQYIKESYVLAEMPLTNKGIVSQRLRWEGGRLRVALTESPKLFFRIFKGQWNLWEPLLDLLTLPLAYQTIILLPLLALPVPFAFFYGLFGLIVIGLHVLTGIKLAHGSWKDYAVLLLAPFYLVWKLLLMGKIFRAARKEFPWERTQRKGEE